MLGPQEKMVQLSLALLHPMYDSLLANGLVYPNSPNSSGNFPHTETPRVNLISSSCSSSVFFDYGFLALDACKNGLSLEYC